jgi:hypothetical protein
MKNCIYIILFLFIISCDNESENNTIQRIAPVNENKTSEQILTTTPSVYGNYLEEDGPLIGYSTMKENALAENVLSPVFSEDQNKLKSSNIDFTVSANGIEINMAREALKSSSENNSFTSNWYGQDVKFVLQKRGALKSGSNSETDTIEMYIPNLVKITSPLIETEEELYPYCYFDDFELGWNADPENKNGLVVMAEWLGTTITEDGDANEYVRNIDVIEKDDGKTTLNNKIFDNIPDKALTYITLLRGNVELPTIDSTTYRLFGESHEVLPIILIRDIED